jgi:hypothetical protein
VTNLRSVVMNTITSTSRPSCLVGASCLTLPKRTRALRLRARKRQWSQNESLLHSLLKQTFYEVANYDIDRTAFKTNICKIDNLTILIHEP